jgi:hypothetical protein
MPVSTPAEEQPKSSDFNFTPPVVLMKGANDPTFAISLEIRRHGLGRRRHHAAWPLHAIEADGVAVVLARGPKLVAGGAPPFDRFIEHDGDGS